MKQKKLVAGQHDELLVWLAAHKHNVTITNAFQHIYIVDCLLLNGSVFADFRGLCDVAVRVDFDKWQIEQVNVGVCVVLFSEL